jgi:hypothetical protein
MKNDLAVLEDRIKKVQMILRLASDPAVAKWIRVVVVEDENSPPVATKPISERKGIRYDILKFVPPIGDSATYKTAKDITDLMEEAKYKFKSKDRAGTVRDALRELEKEGLVQKEGVNEDGSMIWRKT